MIYSTESRYFYQIDTENDIPQSQLLQTNYYNYDVVTVLANEAERLDLVSYRVYNTQVNWWIIARFHSIISPESVQTGMQLRIPRL